MVWIPVHISPAAGVRCRKNKCVFVVFKAVFVAILSLGCRSRYACNQVPQK